MSTPTGPRSAAPPRPGWLVELLEVLELRRRTLLLAVGGVALAGLLGTLLLPSFLPPRPDVGAAVGLAAVLLGVAITFGLDSLDLRVRGPRHVRSSGGLLAQQLSGEPSPDVLDRLVARLAARARADGRVLVGMSPIDADLDAEGWQGALSVALADDGLRVLTVDLQRPAESHPGVVEVVEGATSLADAVTFEDERMVARLGPGRDPAAALGGLRNVIERLPSDIDVLVVLLPPPSGGGVLGAASALDHVYVLAEVDRTARVDLIAALDAFDAVQAASEVLLVRAPAAGAVPTAAPDEAGGEVAAAVDAPEGEPVLESADAPATERPEVPTVPEAPPALEGPEVAPALEEPEDAPGLEEPDVAAELEPPPGPTDEPQEPAAQRPPVVEDADRDHPQLRLMMAEAALGLSDLADLAAPSDEPPAERPVGPIAQTTTDDIAEGDPTVETPPVVLDAPEGGDAPAEEPDEPAAVDGPEPPAPDGPDDLSVVDEPFPDAPDLPEDPAKVAAVLQGLGAELWSPARAEAASEAGSARVTTAPRG